MLSRAATVLKGAVRSSAHHHQPLAKASSSAARPPGVSTVRASYFHTGPSASGSASSGVTSSAKATRHFLSRLFGQLELAAPSTLKARNAHLAKLDKLIARGIRNASTITTRSLTGGASTATGPVSTRTIAQNLSLPSRIALSGTARSRAFGAPHYFPRHSSITPFGRGPGAVNNVGLGTARNFSSGAGKPMFQNLVQNVPVAMRALCEADLDLKLRADGMKMKKNISFAKENNVRIGSGFDRRLQKADQFVTIVEPLGNTANNQSVKKFLCESEMTSSSVKLDRTAAEFEHYFSGPSKAAISNSLLPRSDEPFITTLSIPLSPPSPSLSAADVQDYSYPHRTPLPSMPNHYRDDYEMFAHRDGVNGTDNIGYSRHILNQIVAYGQDSPGYPYADERSRQDVISSTDRRRPSPSPRATLFSATTTTTSGTLHAPAETSLSSLYPDFLPQHDSEEDYQGSRFIGLNPSTTTAMIRTVHDAYTAHAARVTALFRALDAADVWARGARCEAFTYAIGEREHAPVRMLRVRFDGWSEGSVLALFSSEQGQKQDVLDWCEISSEACFSQSYPEDISSDDGEYDWECENPWNVAGTCSLRTTTETEMPEPASMSFIMPTLDFSSTFGAADNEHNFSDAPATLDSHPGLELDSMLASAHWDFEPTTPTIAHALAGDINMTSTPAFSSYSYPSSEVEESEYSSVHEASDEMDTDDDLHAAWSSEDTGDEDGEQWYPTSRQSTRRMRFGSTDSSSFML